MEILLDVRKMVVNLLTILQLNINESVGLNAPDSTNIPLIMINTNNQLIVDEPKINVDFKVIDNFPNSLNYPTDSGNIYSGIAGIEMDHFPYFNNI